MTTMYQKWLDLRAAMRAKVAELHGQGKTPTQIAREIGMSPQRVYQIVWPHGKPEKAKAKRPVNGAASVLGKLGAAVTNSKLTKEQRLARSRKANAAKEEKRRLNAMEGRT